MLKNILVSAAVFVVMLVSSVSFGFIHNAPSNLGGGGLVNPTQGHWTSGLYAGLTDQLSIDGSGNLTTSTVLKGILVQNGGVTAIASASTHLTAAQLCTSSLVTQNLSTKASTSVTTFPTAATLIANCLPNAGDAKYFVFRNTSVGNGNVATLTTNTNINVKVASGSKATISTNEGAIIRMVNIGSSKVDAVIQEYGN